MIVTIIMILTDWLMVGVTKMVYSCKVAYCQGMLFGVHVPGDVAELPEVKTMIEKYQSWMKAFYRWHFAIGTVICFLGMWYMSIFFIAWTVWMTAFFIGVMGKVRQTHRYMYELKMQKGWYEATSEEEQVTSAVDTKTAARTAQMAVPMICHALPLIVLCGPLVIPGLWHAMAVNSESWIIFVCCLLVCGCLLGAALFYDKMGNKIYSEHSDINFQVNCLEKRMTSVGFLASSICNSMAFWPIAGALLSGKWMDWSWMGLYALFESAAGIVMVVLFFIIRRRKEALLKQDTAPMYIDDDYYWRNGWYSNPDDRRLFIQDRYSSMNYTVNLGRTSGKVITGITYGLLIVMMAGFCLWLLKIDFTPVRMQMTDTTVNVTSGYSNISFDRNEIEDVQLLDALPDDNFYKINGSADGKQYLGKFKGKENGKCQMYVTLDVTPILEIKMPEYTVFINSQEEGKAEKWYQELKQ